MLLGQISGDFPTGGPLRLVTTTNSNLKVEGVTLVQLEGDLPWRSYQIPLDGGSSFTAPTPDPVAPPPISPLIDDRGKRSASSEPPI